MPLPPGSSDSGQALLSSKCAAWRSPMLSSSATPSDTSSRLDLNDSLQYVRCCQPRLPHPVVSPGSEMLPFLVVPHFFELMPHQRAAQLSRHLRSIIICAEDIDVRHWISAFLSLEQFWMGWQSILHLWQSHLPWRRLYVSLRWCCRLDSQLRWAQIFLVCPRDFLGSSVPLSLRSRSVVHAWSKRFLHKAGVCFHVMHSFEMELIFAEVHTFTKLCFLAM